MPVNVVSLFAGGGGSSTGYRMAGCNVLAASEFIQAARATYAANYPDAILFPQDVRVLSGAEILSAIGLGVGELDILDGSPPCASFSAAGNRDADWGKVKSYSDTKQRTDDLFLEYARIVKEVQPKVFVAENVAGITTGAAKVSLGDSQMGLFGEHEKTFYHVLRDCGYRIALKVLDAADYGVPQHRRRLIIIGVRNDLPATATHPRPTVQKHVTLREAFASIENTPEELAAVDIRRYEIWNRLQAMPRDESLIVTGDDYGDGYFSLKRIPPDAVCSTLTQTAGNLGAASIVHWDDRKFTIPELKAIMSFPQSYILTGTYAQQAERLGRAVPPLMMKAIASHILTTIFERFN